MPIAREFGPCVSILMGVRFQLLDKRGRIRMSVLLGLLKCGSRLRKDAVFLCLELGPEINESIGFLPILW